MSDSKPQGVNLNASDFKIVENKVYIDTMKTKKTPGMLLIFANWCGHCHRFMPTFNQIENKLGKNFCCASIESNELEGQNKLVSALKFRGYPTICFFDQTGLIINQYDGSRDIQSMMTHICKIYHHCIEKH